MGDREPQPRVHALGVVADGDLVGAQRREVQSQLRVLARPCDLAFLDEVFAVADIVHPSSGNEDRTPVGRLGPHALRAADGGLLVGLYRVEWIGQAEGFYVATRIRSAAWDPYEGAVSRTLHMPPNRKLAEQRQSAVDGAGVGVALQTRFGRVVSAACGFDGLCYRCGVRFVLALAVWPFIWPWLGFRVRARSRRPRAHVHLGNG